MAEQREPDVAPEVAAEATATADADAVVQSADAAGGDGEAPPAEGAEVKALNLRIAELEFQVAELERKLARAREGSPDLEEQLAKEREAATEYMNRAQRAQADFANFKRRAQQEQEQRETLATWRALSAVLPALDSFERAFATLPPSLRGYTWLDGVALIHLQLNRALGELGIAPVAAEPGQPFDPNRHEGIGEVETAEHPVGHVAVVVQRGYEARGLLLRPALVQIARAPKADQVADAAAQPPVADGPTDAPEVADATASSEAP
jgi:molecular chaperone GrpE